MLYLTCTMISSVDLAHYEVSRAKDWVSVDCGTRSVKLEINIVLSQLSPDLLRTNCYLRSLPTEH